MNTQEPNDVDVTRRDFLRGGSLATLMTMLGGVELKGAEAPANAEPADLDVPKVKCGVIGLGSWGREVLGTLRIQEEAEVVSICDTYGLMRRRAKRNSPGAKVVTDYRDMLKDDNVEAVFIATPTHLHKDIAIEAFKAGKHVYCEAPLASTIEDAKAIAKAARDAVGQVFQPGLSLRSHPQRLFLMKFIRTGAMGKPVMARAQWHKKQSWRFTSSNPDRERAMNWRLSKEHSLGLAGEIGIHQLDSMAWVWNALPKAVSGFGGVLYWRDGREVEDTVQAVLEFPGDRQGMCHYTLGNSFDGDHDIFYGGDAAIMMRDSKAWLFKEVDSALLGWEVYARKQVFYKDTGIALVANASKSTAKADGEEELPFVGTPVAHALTAFLSNVNEVKGATEDFTLIYGDEDKDALAEHLAELEMQPAATWKEGLSAAVIAIKTNEAIRNRTRIEFKKEWFELT